ncbi:MAG: non-ribosomal peptide synthetase, partial [Roseiarcus sp.]
MISSQQSFGFRLSRQQERLWRARAHDIGPVRGRVCIDGAIDPKRLRECLRQLVSRHEVLRTRIALLPRTTQPIQIIEESLIEVDIHDFGAVARKDRHRILDRIEKGARFRLLDGSALRIEIICFSEILHYLVIAVSPYCCDAAGLQNFIRELATFYVEPNEAIVEASEPLQYADYSAWQDELLSIDDDPGIRYWSLHRDLSFPPTRLPLENSIEDESSFEPKSLEVRLPKPLVKAVAELAERSSVSLMTVLLGAWVAFLHRHGEGRDVSLQYLSDGRSGPLVQAIGAYSLDLPLTVRVESHEEFAQFLQRLQVALDEHREWLDYAPVIDAGASSLSVRPFGFEYGRTMGLPSAGHVSMSVEAKTTPSPLFRLRLQCLADDDKLDIKFHYDALRFVTTAVERLSEQWSTLLENASRAPDTTISRLQLMSAAERKRLTQDLRCAAESIPLEADGLHTLMERQARLVPEAPALTCGDETWTYAELDRRATALAARIFAHGIRAEDRVGLAIRNPIWMVTAIFAVLKAGGAYVPLDPDHPTERLSFVLEDAAIALLLTDSSPAEFLAAGDNPRLTLDQGVVSELEAESHELPNEARTTNIDARQLAYLIYTSGSTGQPKGVAVSHGAAVHSTLARHSSYLEPVGGYLLLSSFTFDSSIAGLFWTLSQGGRLCLPTADELREPEALARLVERHELSHLLCLPSLYSVLVEHEQARLGSLRTVIVAGESCPPRLPTVHYERLPYARLYNEYGPTEGTVWSTVGEISSGPSLRFVSIGSPVSGVHVALLDERRELVSQGLSGELYIGGAGLARGYFERPDLTAERFVPNPFGVDGERLYRTGDVGRYCIDGSIEFLGRVDHQVKIRGFRIELGEIEAALARLPQIRDAVVLAREDGGEEKRLTAYVVARNGARPVADELRTALERLLPHYMVPSVFVTLDALPLTTNGKIDRKALPAPDIDAEIARRYVAPRTPTEAALCRIWAEVLGLERVGVEDDFFELGGHSLLAVQIVSRIWREFERQLPLRSFFASPVIAEFAAQLNADAGEMTLPELQPASREDALPLSFAQQRLWFLDQLRPGDAAYNIPAALRVIGDFDKAAFAFA